MTYSRSTLSRLLWAFVLGEPLGFTRAMAGMDQVWPMLL